MENLFFFWLVVAVLFLILEVGSPGLFYFLSFCVGAVLSAAASLYFDSTSIQSVVFLAGTIIALLVLKYGIKSWKKHHKLPATNIDALHGKQGIVLETITVQNPGMVKVEGQIWSAKSKNDESIQAGAIIEVVSCTGAFLIVKEVSK